MAFTEALAPEQASLAGALQLPGVKLAQPLARCTAPLVPLVWRVASSVCFSLRLHWMGCLSCCLLRPSNLLLER